MQLGQPVTVTVDMCPDVEVVSTTSISLAAAQQFSLLPAQNTSGNWSRWCSDLLMRGARHQRDQQRAGMSVEVDIDTGHARLAALPDRAVRPCSPECVMPVERNASWRQSVGDHRFMDSRIR